MKIKSDDFLNYIVNTSQNYKFILFYGPNLGLVNLLYNKVLETFSIDINDPFNVSKFNEQNILDNLNIISDTILTFNITSNKRIILLDLSNTSLRKAVIDNIIDSINHDSIEYLVIIKADNLGVQNQLVKFTQTSNIGVLVPCYEETVHEIKIHLANILKDNNVNFSDAFLLSLSSKFSNDSSINKMELDKLNNFLTNNNNISETTLLSLITDNTNTNLNKIPNFCASGDVKNALFFYNKSLDSSVSPIAIIRALVKHFKIIEKILCSVEDGKSIDTAINEVKPPIFFKDKQVFYIQTKSWNLHRINLVLNRLCDTEIKCKSGIFSDKTLTAQLILSTSVMAKNAIKT